MSLSIKLLFRLSALTWIVIGLFLLTLGYNLLIKDINSPYFSLVHFFTAFSGTRDNALIILIAVGLFIGYFKGRYILKKTVYRQINRIKNIQRPLVITDLYTKNYLLLIACMMSLGFLLRSLPIHPDVRGIIDLAVGAALLFGASHYYRLPD